MRRRRFVAAVLAGAGGATALSSTAGSAAARPGSPSGRASGRWQPRAPLPVKRAEVGTAALAGRLFVVGGTVQEGEANPVWASTAVHSYDPRRDRWSVHAPLPKPLTHVGVAASGGRLYAFGGFTDAVHLNPQPDAYVYDPREDRWRRLPDMPTALGSIAVAAVHGRLHLMGGRDSHRVVTPEGSPVSLGFGTVSAHHVFEPDTGSYRQAPPLPGEARDHAGTAVLGGSVHVVGGRVEDVGDNLTRHDVFDTLTRRWLRAAPLPVARSAGAAVVMDGCVVYAGGECRPGSSTETFDDVTLYDPRVDRWRSLTALPGSRHGFGAAHLDGRAYFVGGSPSCGGGASTDTFALSLRH
ncbi:Kelch repeat-containing protein [Streptomyces malaysiensis]|uniref:Galactose oxidase n=1 Tax=Streptomyces malaysiensis subsp. samsunensis TaxID=459658 RepID=A0A9X2M1Z0_STRMQ|nr:kelch repeat-containing protein [Streptomyces samsunensis]MCQ8833616.1 hypothetical protein [Streptomyces samsunensis]